MTECFILECYIGKRPVWTTMVEKSQHIGSAVRNKVWTRCEVSHWQRLGGKAQSAKCGWVLKAQYPWTTRLGATL